MACKRGTPMVACVMLVALLAAGSASAAQPGVSMGRKLKQCQDMDPSCPAWGFSQCMMPGVRDKCPCMCGTGVLINTPGGNAPCIGVCNSNVGNPVIDNTDTNSQWQGSNQNNDQQATQDNGCGSIFDCIGFNPLDIFGAFGA